MPCSRSGPACLRDGTCRNGMQRPRRCSPHWPSRSGRVMEWRHFPAKESGIVGQPSPATVGSFLARSRSWLANHKLLCRLRRLAGLNALLKTGWPLARSIGSRRQTRFGFCERAARALATNRVSGELFLRRPSRAPEDVRQPARLESIVTYELDETLWARAMVAKGPPTATFVNLRWRPGDRLGAR